MYRTRRSISIKEIPWFTVVVVLINVIVWIRFAWWKENDIISYLRYGYQYILKVDSVVKNHDYITLLTSAFMHFEFEHMLNNVILIAYAGGFLENKIGTIRYALLYLGGAILANVVSVFWYTNMHQGNTMSLGASGAGFAIIGSLIYYYVTDPELRNTSNAIGFIVLAMYSLVRGFQRENVNNSAHVGGLLAGFILSMLFAIVRDIFQNKKRQSDYHENWR